MDYDGLLDGSGIPFVIAYRGHVSTYIPYISSSNAHHTWVPVILKYGWGSRKGNRYLQALSLPWSWVLDSAQSPHTGEHATKRTRVLVVSLWGFSMKNTNSGQAFSSNGEGHPQVSEDTTDIWSCNTVVLSVMDIIWAHRLGMCFRLAW